MDSEVSTTMRARKVIYDEYSNAFYVETRVEALERQVATRAKLTDVINRSHDARLGYRKKQVDAEQDIFEKKNEKESIFHKEQLKDHVAHRHVLNSIAHSRVNDSMGNRPESHLGLYGLGTSKLEIQPLIEKRIKEDAPSAKRLCQSKNIQNKRREVKVFDRTKSTSALLKMKAQVQSRPTSHAKCGEGSSLTTPKQLILPPITVRWPRHKATDDKGETIQGARQTGGIDSNRERTGYIPLPTVFVTQRRN